MFFKFPYVDMYTLNLDWMIKYLEETKANLEQWQTIIDSLGTIVHSVNGQTGDVNLGTLVNSVNGQTGNVNLGTLVNSVNGKTGDVEIDNDDINALKIELVLQTTDPASTFTPAVVTPLFNSGIRFIIINNKEFYSITEAGAMIRFNPFEDLNISKELAQPPANQAEIEALYNQGIRFISYTVSDVVRHYALEKIDSVVVMYNLDTVNGANLFNFIDSNGTIEDYSLATLQTMYSNGIRFLFQDEPEGTKKFYILLGTEVDGYTGYTEYNPVSYFDTVVIPSLQTQINNTNARVTQISNNLDTLTNTVEGLTNSENTYLNPDIITYVPGSMFNTGTENNSTSAINTSIRNKVNADNPAPHALDGSIISCDIGYTIKVCIYSRATNIGSASLLKTIDGDGNNPINIDITGYCRWSIKSPVTIDTSDDTVIQELLTHLNLRIITESKKGRLAQAEDDIKELQLNENLRTELVTAQTRIAELWHFPLINVWENMGLATKYQIPGTAKLWDATGTVDLNQCNIWMRDGIHPFRGIGVTQMYANTIAKQFKNISPTYRTSEGELAPYPADWNNKTALWMGTSIPAGSDPEAGGGSENTYPALVCTELGATCINKARGSSCLRINSTTGEYTGMIFGHFLRSVTRTIQECNIINENWSDIYTKIAGAPSTLSAENLAIMKAHSFENLLLPNMNGTETSPDVWVIDYGHNDIRPLDIYGNRDVYIEPSTENIESGLLAIDNYMTANNYANLKTALNNDLTGITNLESFAASINRNCFKGAMNFIIMLILRYNPYARIVIVTDYN